MSKATRAVILCEIGRRYIENLPYGVLPGCVPHDVVRVDPATHAGSNWMVNILDCADQRSSESQSAMGRAVRQVRDRFELADD